MGNLKIKDMKFLATAMAALMSVATANEDRALRARNFYNGLVLKQI